MALEKKEADFKKGEASMTDLQFSAYVELRDKYEALLQEVVVLRLDAERRGSEETVYQFRQYEEMRDKVEELTKELSSLRKENAGLRMQEDIFKNSYKRYKM